MLTEDERRAIVESGPIWLKDGLRATLGGWKDPDLCSVTSARPGFWYMSWEEVQAIVSRPDRRQAWNQYLYRSSSAWLGCLPAPRSDWQTEADYEAAKARGEAR